MSWYLIPRSLKYLSAFFVSKHFALPKIYMFKPIPASSQRTRPRPAIQSLPLPLIIHLLRKAREISEFHNLLIIQYSLS